MSFDLQLKPSCSACGSTSDLYGSNCKHMTLCLTCGKTMAENRGKCYECGTTVTRLIREYNVRASPSSDKSFFIGRFITGLPNFLKRENAENKWSLQKEGLQGRRLTDALREKYKNKPWLLEDETGLSQYEGQLEGAQSATYFLLMMQGKEFSAIPADSWYKFNKVVQYKQLTLDEAEEKMRNRKKTADGYQRWIKRAATNGAAAFGEMEKLNDKDDDSGGGRGLRKTAGDDDENDDWEYEEIFTDDDEAFGNDPEDRKDLVSELPAPPEIKEDEYEEDEENGEAQLSRSGKELKKLLERTAYLNDSDVKEEDEDDGNKRWKMNPIKTSTFWFCSTARGILSLLLCELLRRFHEFAKRFCSLYSSSYFIKILV